MLPEWKFNIVRDPNQESLPSFSQRAAVFGQMTQGTVRLLASLSPARDPVLPEVPTAREQGIDVSLEAWRGIAVPHGTPRPVIAALESAIRRTAESQEFRIASEKLGVRPAFMPAGEFGELIAREDTDLARLMKVMGVKK